jgi:hypothetical protein
MIVLALAGVRTPVQALSSVRAGITPAVDTTQTETSLSVPAGSLDIQQFGAVPNDGIDDSQALQHACAEAFATGRAVLLPAGTYEIDRDTTVVCAGDLCLTGQGQVRLNLDRSLTFSADAADETVTLTAAVARTKDAVAVDDAGRCRPGDLVFMNTTVVAENAWKTPKREVHYNNVSGSTTGTFNLRSLGGSIRNCRIESTTGKSGPVYLQNVPLQVDTDIYEETTLLLENVTLVTPHLDANDPANRAVALYGNRVVLSNVNWWAFDFYPGPGARHGFREIDISDCNLVRLSFWPEQQATIRHCRFTSPNPGDSPVDLALALSANSSCWVTDTIFQGYTHVLSAPAPRSASFTNCQFTNCRDVFAATNTAPAVSFSACTFVNVSGWGDIDKRNLVLHNCTFTEN